MASTIKVNNIQNQCGANIINESANTITIGASGDTIQLACGASQTGFGRTGTVDWDTTAKTASFTAVSGTGYFVNTTSGAITVTLPASPSAGDIVGIKDYAGTFATNNVTVGRNSSLIDGVASDATLATNQLSVFFVYVDGTQGWKATQSDAGSYGTQYIIATGGTITCCGDYKIHTFTGPGTFCVSQTGLGCGPNTVDYLVIAGGGGGGGGAVPSGIGSAGGGAGGYRESSGAASGCYTTSPLGACVSALPVTAQGYPITVGAGGAGAPPITSTGTTAPSGNNSIFSSITSTGGGGGASRSPTGGCGQDGAPGGSGGGMVASQTAGTGNTPPVSPPQGQPGGGPGGPGAGGGGGGATGAGAVSTNPGAAGGAGATSSINTTPTGRAGGGGAATSCGTSGGGPATDGGGNGGNGYQSTGGNGTANTGGGGGGSGAGNGNPTSAGGSGGSGIVIIRYKFQ